MLRNRGIPLHIRSGIAICGNWRGSYHGGCRNRSGNDDMAFFCTNQLPIEYEVRRCVLAVALVTFQMLDIGQGSDERPEKDLRRAYEPKSA